MIMRTKIRVLYRRYEKMLRAFIIVGPQSSGNHLMWDIFAKSGCYGEKWKRQGLAEMVEKRLSPIVWHGSMPKGGLIVQKFSDGTEKKLQDPCWHNLGDRIGSLRWAGYDVCVIVLIREIMATVKSQVHHFPKEIPSIAVAIFEIQKAYRRIFQTLPDDVNYAVVSYEALVHQKEDTLRGLSQMFDFNLNHDIEITNENAKWYGENEKKKEADEAGEADFSQGGS